MPVDPARALARSATNLREQGTFTLAASFTRVLATAPNDVEEYATAKGALDLGAGAGRAELDLGQLFPGREDTPFSRPLKLSWAGKSLTVAVEGRAQAVSRARARSEGGLIGRYPDEVEALHDLLALEAWIEEDGLPHRISYAIRLKPLLAKGKRVLPKRTIRVTYELGDFGDGYDPNG